jgi:hypothetical protein
MPGGAEVSFDFTSVALILAGISFGGIGMVMAGYFLFPDTAEKYKRQLPMVLGGLILLGVANALIAAFGG